MRTDREHRVTRRYLDNGWRRPISFEAACTCGWHTGWMRDQTHAYEQGDLHAEKYKFAEAASRTGRCDGCGDVIPTKMITSVGPDKLCPECFDTIEPVPSAQALINDLVSLEMELR